MITDEGLIEYDIPQDIKSRIPNYFYYAMAGELASVFGPQILQEIESDEEDGYYDLASSTSGWHEAFKATCKKLDMMWLEDYWKTLEWYDADVFDGEIESEIINQFCKKNHDDDHANCYYKYLMEV